MVSMKAVRIHEYGGVDKLLYEDVPRPVAGDGEILIRVHATSVNPFDCVARAGYLTAYYDYALPTILGLDVSGVVEEVGPGVSDFVPGDVVYARADPARNGCYAEYVSIQASDAAAAPPSLDYLQAAALPQVALTAWRSLIEVADLSPGQTALIHGAAGGVGSIAVQLAKWRGAQVLGTCSNDNVGFLQELGVDGAIDYTITQFDDAVKDVDVVLDVIGGDTQERSWATLKPGGLLISIVQAPSEETAASHGVRQQMVAALPPAGEVLKQIASLVEAGHIKPILSTLLPLHEIQKAHTIVEARHGRGKTVLKVM